jgi:hypothetical protein
MPRYEMTVKVTMEARSPADATDGVGEILRPFERPFDGKNGMDWRFDRGPWRLTPDAKAEDSVEGRAS